MTEILSKPVDRIGPSDIESLITLKVSESEQIEFKAELSTKAHGADPWTSGDGKIGNRARDQILEEVTAFANAFGGALILGIRESGTTPPVAGEIAPIKRCMDLSERLKLIFRDCVDPPLPMIEIVGVPFDDDCGVIVIRVGRSRLAPHRVKPTLVCPIRRQDRCETMTMREIQDMTLNVSRGMERLDKRLSERSLRFPGEFDKLSNPQNAFGIRMTALPVGDEFRFDRVFSQGHIIEGLQEPWRKVIETKSSGEQGGLLDLPHQFKPHLWKPMLRAARAEPDSNSKSTKRKLSSYREIHCDGLIEWGLLSCEKSPRDERACPLLPDWPIVLLANLIAWAHRVRDEAGAPMAEYALEIQICARGSVKVPNPENDYYQPWLGRLEEDSRTFPRYALGNTDEGVRLLSQFRWDFRNWLGKDIGAEESTLKVENWPEQKPDQGT